MHDPMTVAFEIKYPWKDKPSQFWPKGYRNTFITIWHNDPETDGTDDSCGWFKRARHGDKAMLERIRREFDHECYAEHGGYFNADGTPRYSSLAITTGLFRRAAYIVLGENWKKVDKFMARNFIDIVMFAENPIDSLHQNITNKYGVESRERRVENFASIIYGWILRAETPWYRHARWHIHHWSIQIHPLQQLKRYLFDRCAICRKGFKWNESVCGSWSGDKIWHMGCDNKKQPISCRQENGASLVN